MVIIKNLLIGTIGLFVVVTLMSLLLPSDIKVSRAVIINAPEDSVYKQIADFKNWKNWHPLFKNDSSVITFSNPSFGKNAYCNIIFNGKKSHLVITNSDSSFVQFLSQEKDAFDIENEISIVPVKEQNNLRIEWKALTKLHWYPWDKFYGIFIDRITGNGYQQSLESLKDYIEMKR